MINSPVLRSRATWGWLAAMIVAAVLGILLLWRADRKVATLTPGVYLVASDGPVTVRVGFRTRGVLTSLAIPAGKTFSLKAGVQVDALYPDGHRQHVTGAMKLALPKPKVVDGDFLTNPLLQVLNTTPKAAATTTLSDATTAQIHVMSPSGVTRFLNPIISWQAKDDQRYDVAVVDLADQAAPPRVIGAMRPPVALASLATPQGPQLVPDRLYGVIVRQTNDPAVTGSSRFLTSPGATVASLPDNPASLLEEAYAALTADPARIGDAWQALSRLPDDWRRSELAVRLRLRVADELHLTEDFAQAEEDVKVLAHR